MVLTRLWTTGVFAPNWRHAYGLSDVVAWHGREQPPVQAAVRKQIGARSSRYGIHSQMKFIFLWYSTHYKKTTTVCTTTSAGQTRGQHSTNTLRANQPDRQTRQRPRRHSMGVIPRALIFGFLPDVYGDNETVGFCEKMAPLTVTLPLRTAVHRESRLRIVLIRVTCNKLSGCCNPLHWVQKFNFF